MILDFYCLFKPLAIKTIKIVQSLKISNYETINYFISFCCFGNIYSFC